MLIALLLCLLQATVVAQGFPAKPLQIIFSDIPIAVAQSKTGKPRAIAVTSGRRSPLLPDMPTVAESGVRGYAVDNWWGIPRSGDPAGV